MRRQRKETNYWMSYADLMSAMLMVFVLLLAVIIQNYHEDMEEKQRQIDAVTNVKNDIIGALTEEFKGSNLNIEVDPQTGAIRFPGNILYDSDSSVISPEGKTFLRTFVPNYFGIILQERFKNEFYPLLLKDILIMKVFI
jgi:chemotaxis protein MotB